MILDLKEMFKNLIFLCSLFLLSSCVSALYSNERVIPKYNKNKTNVTWIRLSHDKIQKKCEELGINFKVLGCTLLFKNHCIIYAPEIKKINDRNTLILGHEAAHCFLGQYHKQ